MSSDPFQSRIDELFGQAKDLSPEEQRDFLNKARLDNPIEVCRRVERLLSADPGASG